MDCWVRGCKDNKEGSCQRLKDMNELKEQFAKHGGCARTWYMTGVLPSLGDKAQ